MKPFIPWLRVFVEGVVIVGSILLAFGIDAWWEERQEREEEQEILRGLESDFSANLRRLGQIAGLNGEYEDRLLRFAEMGTEGWSLLPPDSLRLYAQALVATRTFDPRDGTLDGALSSGKLELIVDTELRNRLMEWKRHLMDADEEAARLRSLGEQATVRAAALGGPWLVYTRERLVAAAHPSVVPRIARLPDPDLESASRDPSFAAISGARRSTILLYLDTLHRMADAAESISALIRANLN